MPGIMKLLNHKPVQIFFFSLALVLISFAAMAQPKATITEKYKDAGTHTDRETITIGYTIRNEGNERLTILWIRPSCSCVTPVFDSIIEPGKTATIKATINLVGQSGELYRAMLVKTNDPVKSTVELRMRYLVTAKTSSSELRRHPGQGEVSWASQKDPSLFRAADAAL